MSSERRSRVEQLRQELLWRKCRSSEQFALENFWHIKTPNKGKQRFELRPAQLEAIDDWNNERYSLTLKARQIGWSTVVAAHVWWETFFFPDREELLISRGEREAVDLMAKIKYGLKFLPDWLAKRGPYDKNDNKQMIDWSNGSSVKSLPSASDPARGSSAYRIVVDEWAFLPNAEEAWGSIEPVADVGGRITGLSTANGAGNFFHNLWVEAETGVNNFKPMFHPWSANTDRDEAWYEAKKRSMPAWQLAQEYPRNPEEAFIKSGDPVFDTDLLMQMRKRTATPRVGALLDVP